MLNRIFNYFICFLFPGLTMGQHFEGHVPNSKLAFPAGHYQNEYTADITVNPEAWKKETTGMHVSFASTDESWFRSEVPDLKSPSLFWEATGWKGERLNAEVLVWATDSLQQVRFTLKDLRNNKGRPLSKNNVIVNMVRYVIGNAPYGAKDATCSGAPYNDLYLMPDRFEAFDRFDVPGKTIRPVWVSFNIPANAEAGIYSGIIEVNAVNYAATLHVKLNVQNLVLPKPHEWMHRLDLWQNPWVIATMNNLKPWSPEHLLLLKKHLQLYADAGGKYITTYAVNSPWSDNSYATEGGMINWIKRIDGSWKFDYAIFDTYINLATSIGIDKAITVYTPVPGGYRFNYMDEKTGNMIYVTWPPSSKEFKDFWEIFLSDFKKHLEQKGWFEKTYIGINENPLDETLAAIKMVRENSPQWKITYAGDWHKELENLLDDYCFVYGKESNVDVVKQRAAKGFTTTWYVCCTPPMPNNFVFSPPVEGRWQGWYSVAHSYNGFLRWAYDAWPADPSRDARHGGWPAGDCYLVYPGGNSCVRFEKLREGIVDYEKIIILRAKTATSKNKEILDLMKQLDNHLNVFLTEKDFITAKIKADIDKGRELIRELTNKLSAVVVSGKKD
jgi:hypothetical protein